MPAGRGGAGGREAKLSAKCKVRIEHLPADDDPPGRDQPATSIRPACFICRDKYVVPGGRFNEMYGWDSYFIIRGCCSAGRVDLARGMVDNFFFEIENYGAMLNANRTYYLTRSQPPFLSSMFVEVYQACIRRPRRKKDKAWLERAYKDLNKDYGMWTHDPHLAGQTGLSRYYDFGDGPPHEAVKDETGFYRKVCAILLLPSRAGRRLRRTKDRPEAQSNRLPDGLFVAGLRCRDDHGAARVRAGSHSS